MAFDQFPARRPYQPVGRRWTTNLPGIVASRTAIALIVTGRSDIV